MRQPQVPLQITITHSEEKADLSWVTGMLVRWSKATPVPTAHGGQPAGAGTPNASTDTAAGCLPHSFTSRPA